MAPVFPLVLAACAGAAEPGGSPVADSTIVGWYELEAGRQVVVTPGASEGYWLAAAEPLRFDRITPLPGGIYRWDVGGGHAGEEAGERLLTPVSDDDGRVTALQWRGDGGVGGVLERVRGAYALREIRFPNGELTLAGTLMVPITPGPHPGVVMIHGSGSSDRDSHWYLYVADHLARHGVAVLLPDKRGSGESGGDWRAADFEELADDALAALQVLRASPGVDPGRVGVFGFSQGGRVAPVAGARSNDVAFVINVSGDAVPFADGMDHEMEATTRQAGLGDDAVAVVLELNRLAGEYLRTGEWQSYADALSAAAEGPAAPIAEGFPQTRDVWQWEFLRGVWQFDPLPAWAELEQPVLVVYGAEDEADNVPVRRSVERLREGFERSGRSDATIRVFQSSGHSIGDPATGWIRRDFLDLLVDWIRRSAANAALPPLIRNPAGNSPSALLAGTMRAGTALGMTGREYPPREGSYRLTISPKASSTGSPSNGCAARTSSTGPTSTICSRSG